MQTLPAETLADLAIADAMITAALAAAGADRFADCSVCGAPYAHRDGEPADRYCLDCALDVAGLATLPAELAEAAAAEAEAAGGSADDRRAAVAAFVHERINGMPAVGRDDRAAVVADVLHRLGLSG